MSKTVKLGAVLYLSSILAAVMNIRFRFMPVTWISVGRFIVGEIGDADGIRLIVTVLIDLVVYAVFFFVIAFAIRSVLQSKKSTSNFR